MVTDARKRLGRETQVQEAINCGLFGLRPGSKRDPLPALRAFPSKGRSLKGLHSRRNSALQVVGRSNVHAAPNPCSDSRLSTRSSMRDNEYLKHRPRCRDQKRERAGTMEAREK